MNSNRVKASCDVIMETHEEFIRIRTGVERLMLPAAQSYGLTPTQVAVLNLIRKNGMATVSSLFKALDFNQGNMSSMCKKLEADGFIKKIKCTDDERKSYLTLTDKATEALDGIDRVFTFEDSESWITTEEFERAVEAVAVLREVARKINDKMTEALGEETENIDA